MEDFPANTHFKTDILISYSTFLNMMSSKNDLDHMWEADGYLHAY